MNKSLLFIFALFYGVAFAAGENIPTSKSYVDNAIAQKQDIIPKNDGATQVLTNTGIAGDYTTKGIYDVTGEYATQQNNLIDAATMNSAVQNAIDSEFQCVEYDENNECLLMNINPVVRESGIGVGDGKWCRAYLNSDVPTNWQHYKDASSSIILPIKPNVMYKLAWDSGYGSGSSIYRVAFVKGGECPTSKIPVYKPDGTRGAAFRSNPATYPVYRFRVTDNSLKYMVVQINGYMEPWESGDFTRLWNDISHLHITMETWLDENKN